MTLSKEEKEILEAEAERRGLSTSSVLREYIQMLPQLRRLSELTDHPATATLSQLRELLEIYPFTDLSGAISCGSFPTLDEDNNDHPLHFRNLLKRQNDIREVYLMTNSIDDYVVEGIPSVLKLADVWTDLVQSGGTLRILLNTSSDKSSGAFQATKQVRRDPRPPAYDENYLSDMIKDIKRKAGEGAEKRIITRQEYRIFIPFAAAVIYHLNRDAEFFIRPYVYSTIPYELPTMVMKPERGSPLYSALVNVVEWHWDPSDDL